MCFTNVNEAGIRYRYFMYSTNKCTDFNKNITLKKKKKPVRTLSIFMSMAFVKDANGISFKNRLKGHINRRKVRNFIII